MGGNTFLFVKSKFSKSQLVEISWVHPVHPPGVLLIKGSYALMHISVYTSYEMITYTTHSNIQFLSLWKLNEMKVDNTSLGNPEEENWKLCLKSIAIIFHRNSYCRRKPSEILPQSLSAVQKQSGIKEHHWPRQQEIHCWPALHFATFSISPCLCSPLSLETTPNETHPWKDALWCTSGIKTFPFFCPVQCRAK